MTEQQRWRPTPAQERFLACSAFEALYGGAAGGGKSEALLVGATRHVANPNYTALLLRRTVPELKRANGLIDRAFRIFPTLGGVSRESGKSWTFPSGARIELSSMEHENDRFNYLSSEYQYIAFDELTSFTEKQYTYMISRLRSAHGIPLRLRAGSNPGGEGHDWVLKRFAPWLYPPDSVEWDGECASPGERLYYRLDPAREEDVVCARDWHDESCSRCSPGAACAKHRPLGRVFFPATVEDNPYLAGTEYEAALDRLDPVTRAQMKFGDWLARPARGLYFNRAWFRIIDVAPTIVRVRVRYWDRAATEDPRADFSAGCRLSRTDSEDHYVYVVEDMRRGQWDPGEVEAQEAACCEDDPEGTYTVLEKDPGQAGKAQARHDLRQLDGYDVRCIPPQGNKLTRMKPVSAQARPPAPGEHGNIVVVRGRWNEAFFRELEACPEGRWDQIDALSGAYSQCLMLSGARAATLGKKKRVAVAGRMGGW